MKTSISVKPATIRENISTVRKQNNTGVLRKKLSLTRTYKDKANNPKQLIRIDRIVKIPKSLPN